MRDPYLPPAAVPYPHPLIPLDLDFTRLHNRVVMDSVHTGLENRLWGPGKLAAYYHERAQGGVELIITGGFVPCREGWLLPFGSSLASALEVPIYRRLTQAVHAEGDEIPLQVLHAGHYSYHPIAVPASSLKSPISWFTPRGLPKYDTHKTIRAFVRCAQPTKAAAYDGAGVMGSEDYLPNQFFCPRANRHDDQWGDPLENRMCLALEIVRGIRWIAGEHFILCYRLSLLDLVEGGNTWDEVRHIAPALEEAGTTLFDTGTGWHESRVPTIVISVPCMALTEVSTRLRHELKVPVITDNRINTPGVAESLFAAGKADLVSMARPSLVDPQFVAKAGAGRAEEVNTCIVYNRACLDHAFADRRATCLVSPRAAFETELRYCKAHTRKRIAVVGAGPAELSVACVTAECGRRINLFETSGEIGGQFNLAKRIPGKGKLCETLRYFHVRLERLGVDLYFGHRVCQGELDGQFDDVVVAAGVQPCRSRIDDIGGPTVLSYMDVLRGVSVGAQVAIVGADSIGFDVAVFPITAPNGGQPRALGEWLAEWGVGLDNNQPGGLREPAPTQPAHQVWLLQRKPGAPGAQLGRTSG